MSYIAPDGTPVSIKDMNLLLELNKTNLTRWLRDYKKNKERSNDMTKKKAKKTKKKVSALDKIQKSLNKLEALHEKQSDMIFDINELIEDAQMDDDNSYHLD
jgi:flagellar biosynthesis chaperone FliJ